MSESWVACQASELLDAPAVGDVLDRAEERGGEPDRPHRHGAEVDPPLVAHRGHDACRQLEGLAVERGLEPVRHGIDVVGVHEPHPVGTEQFLGGRAGELGHAVVDVAEPQPDLGGEDADGCALGQGPEALLAGSEQLVEMTVDDRGPKAEHPTRLLVDGGRHCRDRPSE